MFDLKHALNSMPVTFERTSFVNMKYYCYVLYVEFNTYFDISAVNLDKDSLKKFEIISLISTWKNFVKLLISTDLRSFGYNF